MRFFSIGKCQNILVTVLTLNKTVEKKKVRGSGWGENDITVRFGELYEDRVGKGGEG